jgi:hypothetical protein
LLPCSGYSALPQFGAVLNYHDALSCPTGNYSIVCNGVPLSHACGLLSRLIDMIADCCITFFTFPLVIYLLL